MERSTCLLIAAAFAVAAARPAPNDWKSETLRSAAPFIDEANREWASAIVTGDTKVLSRPYAADSIFIRPDGATVHGKAAVGAMYARRPRGVKLVKATIRSDGRAAPDAEDVYEWGTAHMTIKRGKLVRDTSRRYLTVWHRDGRHWLITRNIAF